MDMFANKELLSPSSRLSSIFRTTVSARQDKIIEAKPNTTSFSANSLDYCY